MKVIIIKECKDGKVNDVINVSAGYATNFLIKTGLAEALNAKSKKALNKRLNSINDYEEHVLQTANKVKKIIEGVQLLFKLDVTNNKVHGSITRKQIIKELRKRRINLDSRTIDNVKIESIGITKVKINLAKDVVAKLKIEVRENGK